MSGVTDQINEVLAMTKRIRELVENDNGGESVWDEVSLLVKDRQAFLEGLLSKHISPEQADAVKAAITAILQSDAETSRLLEIKKRFVAEELACFAKGRNAQQAYLDQSLS